MRATALLVLLSLSLSAVSRADCPRPEGVKAGSVATRGDAERLKFLSSRFTDESAAATRWTGGWGGAYGLFTIVQLAIAPLFPEEERPDWYWGAFSTAVGVAFSIIDPLEVLYGGPEFARRAATVTPDATCALIADGERMLREGAAHEATGRKWYVHLANVLFNAGIGVVLGLAHNRWVSGAINAAVGLAIGEATIFTSPNGLGDALVTYESGAPIVTFRVVPAAGPGVGVLLTF